MFNFILFYYSGNITEYCCKGYCIDLLVNLSTRVNFSFDVHMSTDNTYGSFERVSKALAFLSCIFMIV